MNNPDHHSTLENQYTSGLYTKRPIAIVRGQGARLWDADGSEYIDCVGGQGAANLGHCQPGRGRRPSPNRPHTLISCPEMFYNDQRAALEAKLCALAGMPRVFLCNSGAEAIEAAHQVCAPVHRAHRHRRRHARLPRAHDGRALGHLGEEIPRALRAAGPRLQPRPLQRPGRAAKPP